MSKAILQKRMEKSLSDIDKVYKDITSFMSLQDRIIYCECLIKENEHFLQNHTSRLDIIQKTRYHEIIVAARMELDRLKGSH